MASEQARKLIKGMNFSQIGRMRKGTSLSVAWKDASVEINRWSGNAIKDGVLNEQNAMSLAMRFTAREYHTTIQRIELVLMCERMEQVSGYVSVHGLLRYLPARMTQGVARLLATGLLTHTGVFHKPLTLTRGARDVCDTFRKHWRMLRNSIVR